MRTVALAVGLLLTVAACRPLYLPPVPADLPAIEDRLRVVRGEFLVAARPALQLSVESAPEEGWLVVQWFAPAGDPLASESVRIRPDDVPRDVTFELPEDAMSDRVNGRLRAVVTFNESFVGQWDTDWPQ